MLSILSILMMSGVSSLVERSLMATVQQSQSPTQIPLFGFMMLMLDGMKLFTKLFNDTLNKSSVLLGFVSIIFLEALVMDMFFRQDIGGKVTGYSKFIVSLILLIICEFFTMVMLQLSQNHFVNIAIHSLLCLSFMSELVVEFLMMLFSYKDFWSVESNMLVSWNLILMFFMFLILFVPILIGEVSAPFDLIEAESELIDGLSTDIGGIYFSLLYASEVASSLFILKMFLMISLGFLSVFMMVTLFLIPFWFYSKCAFASWSQVDVIEYLISFGMILTILVMLFF